MTTYPLDKSIPCPFCGTQEPVYLLDEPRGLPPHGYYQCQECGSRGPVVLESDMTMVPVEETRGRMQWAALRLWNISDPRRFLDDPDLYRMVEFRHKTNRQIREME